MAIDYRHFILFALLGCAACQDRPYFEKRMRFTLSSSGPAVSITLQWDAVRCRDSASYLVKLCWGRNACVSRQIYRTVEKFDPSASFPQVFFNTYTATISYRCWGAGWTTLSRRKIFTGAGELVPPSELYASGGNQNVTITWQKPASGISVVGDYVEITACHRLSNNCLETHQSSYDSGKYTVTQLSSGVEYTAKISVCKSYLGVTYRSKPVSVNFMTDPPEVREYPPVNNFVVQVRKKSKDVDLELSYTKPKGPSGAEFIGVRLDIVDKANSTVVEGMQTNDTTIKIENLPYFAHFTVEVRALYDEVDEVIESEKITRVIATGTEVLPDKPQILEVMSISNSSALIRWSHTAHKSVEFSYKVSLNDEVTMGIERLNANYTVIGKGLEPNGVYNVTFIALLSYAGKSTGIASEQRQFRMLPADALVAEFSVEDIEGHFIHLKWDVKLPQGTPKCYLSVNHCRVGNACTRTIISNMTERTAHLEIEPFENYNITMNTTCMFVPDIIVSGISKTMNVLAATRPPAVFKLFGDSSDENTLSIFWTAGPPYVRGYKVNYSVASADLWKQLDTREPNCVISNLESSTAYNVSVSAYSMNGNEILLGPPTTRLFQTLNHVPPGVTELVVYQVPFKRTIRMNWKAPAYDKGHLSYRVAARCQTPLDFWTNETSFEFKSREAPSSSTYCAVSVQSFNLGFNRPAFSGTVHAALTLQTLPPPAGAEAVFEADGKYLIKIAAPKIEGVKELEYQVSPDREFLDRRRTNEIVVEEGRFDTEVSYAVRVCVNDLCSPSYNLVFTTNTGRPGRVSSMSLKIVDVTSIQITWSKPEQRNGPIDGFIVDVTETGDRGKVLSFQKTGGDTSLIFEANEEYTKYDVSVRAFNYDKLDRTVLKVGKPEVEPIETEGRVPRPPLGVSSAIVRGSKLIQWDPEGDKKFVVARYKITATAVATQNQTVLFSTKPVFELSVLVPYTHYVLRISACIDAVGNKCGKPTAFEETTDVGYPSSPDVRLVSQNGTHVLFRWSEPTKRLGPIDGYEFAYTKKATGLSPSNWVPTGIDDRSAAVDKLDEETDYIFHVRAYNIDSANKKLYSPVGVLEATTNVARGDASVAVVAASASMGFAGLAALAYVGYRKFGYSAFRNQ